MAPVRSHVQLMLLALLCAAGAVAAETLTVAEPSQHGSKHAQARHYQYGPQFAAYNTQLQQANAQQPGATVAPSAGSQASTQPSPAAAADKPATGMPAANQPAAVQQPAAHAVAGPTAPNAQQPNQPQPQQQQQKTFKAPQVLPVVLGPQPSAQQQQPAQPAAPQCTTGFCCDLTTQRFKPAEPRTKCRAPTHQCDQPEYCTGNSATCPPDDQALQSDGQLCYWLPPSTPSMGRYYSDSSSLQRSSVSLQAAASLMTSQASTQATSPAKPQGASQAKTQGSSGPAWSPASTLEACMGVCRGGLCTVNFGTLHCCMAHQRMAEQYPEDDRYDSYEANDADGYEATEDDRDGPYTDRQSKDDFMYDPKFAPYILHSRAAAAPGQRRSRGPEAPAKTKKLTTSSATDQATVLGSPDFFYDQFKDELLHEAPGNDYRMRAGEYERRPLPEEPYYGNDFESRREEGPYGREEMEGDGSYGDGKYGYDTGILYQGAVCWN